MARFHIGKSGEPTTCHATTKACPLGGEHYDSMREAMEASMPAPDHEPELSILDKELIYIDWQLGPEAREEKVLEVGANYLKQAGLHDWKVEVVDSVGKDAHTMGTANYADKTIRVKRAHAHDDSRESIINTLQHEVAHAKVGPGHGHNHHWKHAAVELGITNPTAKSYGDEKDALIREGKLKVSDIDKGFGRPGSGRTKWDPADGVAGTFERKSDAIKARAGVDQFADRHKDEATKKEEAATRKAARELDPAMIEALKLRYLKAFKQPFDESGLSIGELLQMASKGEI